MPVSVEIVNRSVVVDSNSSRWGLGGSLLKNRVHRGFIAILAVAGILALSACGGGSGGNVTVTAINITPVSGSVGLNGTAEFTAVPTLSNQSTTSTTNTTVQWAVNGTIGGTAATGTIASLPTDNLIGVFVAPASVPDTNAGVVSITAVSPQNPADPTDTNTVTSNTASLTITEGTGLQVTPSATSVNAGQNFTFSAFFNGLPDFNVTWSVASQIDGSIDPHSGVYTAPPFPPPGATVTITATDGANVGSATARIVYSNNSLSGPYAFSYTGNGQAGFQAFAGSFVADGNGNIVSGVEDIDSFTSGVSTQVAINSGSTYTVTADGRGTITINPGSQTSSTLEFALTTNQHATLIRFDTSATGSGSLDQQNVTDLSNSNIVISGPYVFSVSGADSKFKPAGIAGKFSTDGLGDISALNSIVDIDDNGVAQTEGTLTGCSACYSFDPMFAGTGRGTITLSSTTSGSQQYAFYIIDSTHLHLIEIDKNAFLAGDMFTAAAGNSFSTASLAKGTYVFTAGGTSNNGAFAAGGVFNSDGAGNISGGIFDDNDAGAFVTNSTVKSCPYTVDQATGRIQMSISFGTTGDCDEGSSQNLDFAAYQTVQGNLLMLELDATPITSGTAFPQTVAPNILAGSFAANLAGQGIVHSAPGSSQQDVGGQLTFEGLTLTGGNLDINNFNAVFFGDPVNTTTSTVVAPVTNGRGTALIFVNNPKAHYTLVYYVIDNNTALLLDQDSTLVATGIVALQF
jgi:hypothetical protein